MNSTDAYDFLVNGYVHGSVPFIQKVDVDSYNFSHCDDPNFSYDSRLDGLAEAAREWLSTNYVGALFANYEFLKYNAWSGVDQPSSNWHNDQREGFNSNILVYLDDSLNCNSIEVKSDNSEVKIYPKKGDFVWLNQRKAFRHRATHIEGTRRVLSFEFNINDLWT